MFLDLLNEAVGIILQRYPGAELLEVDSATYPEGLENPDDIKNWRFVFMSDNFEDTIFLKWEDGDFSEPVVVPQPWLQDQVIPLPIEYDLAEAVEGLKTASLFAPFVCVTLRKPLYPGVTEASYIFGCLSVQKHYFVGVDSHEITWEGMPE